MRIRAIAVIALTVVAGVVTSSTAATAAGTTTATGVSAQGKPCGEIREHPELSRGDSGSAVRHAQCLIHYGFSDGIAIDGDFGPETEKYVTKVQATCRIDVDGIIGPDTWACLHSGN